MGYLWKLAVVGSFFVGFNAWSYPNGGQELNLNDLAIVETEEDLENFKKSKTEDHAYDFITKDEFDEDVATFLEEQGYNPKDIKDKLGKGDGEVVLAHYRRGYRRGYGYYQPYRRYRPYRRYYRPYKRYRYYRPYRYYRGGKRYYRRGYRRW